MVGTKLHSINSSVCGSIEYITNGDKTRDHRLVEAFMCSSEPSKAAADFKAVRVCGMENSLNDKKALHLKRL